VAGPPETAVVFCRMGSVDRWMRHPQPLWPRRVLFQVHLWTGIGAGLYLL